MIRGMVTTEYKLDILCFKNIIVAPLFEEFIYRICLINMFLEAQALSEQQAVVYLPLYFAVSHLHHELTQPKEGYSYRSAILRIVFKLLYT